MLNNSGKTSNNITLLNISFKYQIFWVGCVILSWWLVLRSVSWRLYFKVFVIFMISQEVVRNVGMKIHEFFDVWKRGGQTLMYTHIVNVGFFLLFTCFGSLISTLFIFNSTLCVTWRVWSRVCWVTAAHAKYLLWILLCGSSHYKWGDLLIFWPVRGSRLVYRRILLWSVGEII